MATGFTFKKSDYIGTLYGARNEKAEVNIIVSDSDSEQFGEIVKKAYVEIADSLDEYTAKLNEVANTLIVSGDTHDALVEFIALFTGLADRVREIGAQHKSLCTLFIKAIDELDKEIYEPGCDPRDFTSDRMSEYARAVDDAKGFFNGLFDNWIGNVVENLKYKVYKFCAKLTGNTTSKTARKLLLDALDYDVEDIAKIHKAIISEDSNRATMFAQLYDQFAEILVIIGKANEIVSGGKSFTYAEVHALVESVNAIQINDYALEEQRSLKITVDNAQLFCAEKENLTFYDEFSSIIDEARKNMNITDAMIASVSVAGASAYAEIFKKYSVPSSVSGTEVYEYLMIKEELAQIVAKTAGNELDISEYLKDENKLKELLKMLKKGDNGNGNDFYGALMEAVNKASKVTGYGIDAMEILLPILWDYSKNVEVIQSLANGTDPNSLTALAVEQLIQEYEASYLLGIQGVVDKAMEELCKKGAGELKKVMLSCLSNAADLNVVSFAVKKVAELSDITAIGQDIYKFECLREQNDQLEKAYEHNFKIVASGDYTQSDVENLNNSFTILREHYSKQFTLLKNVAANKGNHDEKRYYEYLANAISKTNVEDVSSFKPMSYDEFLAA